MAKRKKLNVRLIAVLSVILFILMIVGAYGGYKRGWHRKIIRIDPVEAVRKAEVAKAKGEYRAAERQLGRAISGSRNPTEKADNLYLMARLQLDWLTDPNQELNDAQRTDGYRKAVQSLQQAIIQDYTHLDSQRLLTELMWGVGIQGNWMAFIKEADALLALTPEDDRTTFMRALAWSDLARAVPGTNSTNAIRDFRRAIELKSDEPRYRREYTRFLQQEGRVDEAVRAYEDAIEAIPDDGDLRVQYASLLTSQDRPGEALGQIRQAIARDPGNPTGNLALADRMLKAGKADDALAALEDARQVDDSDYRVYGVLSTVYRAQNQPDKSLAALRDGLAVVDKRLSDMAATSPADDRMRRILEGNRYQLLALLGNSLVDEATTTDDREAAATLLAQAKDTLDQMTPMEVRVAPGQREKLAGRLAFLEGNITEAQTLLEEAYRVLGLDRQVANDLIRIYLRKDLPGKAEQILDALRRDPTQARDPRILLAKAQLEVRYGNVEEATRLVDQILRANPKDAGALALRQTILALKGEASADKMLAAGAETPRSVITALVSRARSLWLSDQRDEAIALLEKVHAKVPNEPIVQRNLLAYYLGVEDLPKAKGILGEIKAAYPERTATLELQEKFIEETDRQKRYELALQLADLNEDPLRRAMEKADHSARYGDVEAQGRYLREAYEIRPDEPAVVERLLEYALETRDEALVEQCLETARKFNLDQVGGKLFAARVAMGRRDYATAIQGLTQAVEEQPDSKFAWIMLGDCYSQLGDLDKAEKAYLTVAKTDPAYVPALLAMAMLTERRGQMSDHAAWVERAHRLAPTHPYIQEKYLEILENRGDVAQVVAQRERLLRERPLDVENRVRLAVVYEKQQQYAKAEEIYARLYADNPGHLLVARMLAGFYVRTGQSAQAEALLANLLETAADKVGAHLVYAEYLTGASLEQARAAVAKAIEIDPSDTRAYRALAGVLVQGRDWAGAADALSKYVELRPDDAGMAENVVRYRTNAGQLSQAEQELQALLAARPSDPGLLVLKGNLAMSQGNVSQAQEAYNRALQIDSGHTEALVGQASVFLAQGRPIEAKVALTRATGVSRNPLIAMVLADLHLRLGDVDMAANVLRDVLSYPETADYSPAVKELLRIYERQRRWPKLVELLSEARAKFPNDPYYLMAEARMHRQRGDSARMVAAMEEAMKLAPQSRQMLVGYLLSLMEAGDLNRTVAVTDNYKDKPNYGPAAAAVRARALVKLNRTEEADALFLTALESASPVELAIVVDQLRQAVGLDVAVSKMAEWVRARPENMAFHQVLGGLYSSAANFPKAAEAFTKASALATRPADKAATERDLGLVYYQMGQFAQAEQAYLASLQAVKSDVTTLNNLAYMYVNDLDQASKGLPYAAQAAQLAPGNPDILDTYGWALAKSADYVEAERQLTRALQLTSAPEAAALVRYHLGWVCEQMRRFEEAGRHYNQGLEAVRDPDDPLHKDLSEGLKRVAQMRGDNP